MNEMLKRAKELEPVLIQDRRTLHREPEVGNHLPKTVAYVVKRLKEMGYEPEEICQGGVVATVGKPGKTILLRADMDALPMREETDLPFRSINDYGHTCGHDAHTAMLLGAAKLLKEREDSLPGTVKLMFQPDEEGVTGAGDMIRAGVLENPKVDVAFGIHISAGGKPGSVSYCKGATMASTDRFSITLTGKGGHGAYPQGCIDPINAGAHLVLALQEIIAREVNPSDPAVLTVGSFHGGTAPNIIPDTVVLEGTIRAYDNKVREFVNKRLVEMVEATAKVFRCTGETVFTSSVCPLISDPDITEEYLKYIQDIVSPDEIHQGQPVMGSEDFALIAQEVPALFIHLGAEMEDGQPIYGGHNPKVRFNEKALAYGAALHAYVATRWLEEHQGE